MKYIHKAGFYIVFVRTKCPGYYKMARLNSETTSSHDLQEPRN